MSYEKLQEVGCNFIFRHSECGFTDDDDYDDGDGDDIYSMILWT